MLLALIPSVVLLAAKANAAECRGITMNDRHIRAVITAGPAKFTEENEARMLAVDGTVHRLRYMSVTQNGTQIAQSEVAKRESRENDALDRGNGFFKQPYDQRYLADYTFDPPSVQGSQSIVPFRSLVRDDQHGDGTMRVANATGRVLEVDYTPDVLPKHATSGTTTEYFGEPIAGLWTIVRIERTYQGRVAFFHGDGNVSETLDHFKRFPSLAAGLQALEGTAPISYRPAYRINASSTIPADTK